LSDRERSDVDNVVMKFGGTSVADADAIRRLIDIVKAQARRSGAPPVVVVSAMSKVTDHVLKMAADASRGERQTISAGVDELWQRHSAAAEILVPARDREPLIKQLQQQIEELRAMLTALAILREASPRSLDGIASAGELLSSRLVAGAFVAAGVDAVWIDARRAIVTDDHYTAAAPLMTETEVALETEVMPHLAAGRLPVVGGYVGATKDGVATTLGRGGSDYSAAIIGAGLGAAEIQIWTDVDGMLTADPRLVDSPRVVPHLSFGEASELAYFGAKVLHPSTILPAVADNIPVKILNSRKPEVPGTVITATPPQSDRPIAALACKRKITVVEVTSTRMLMAHGFLRRLFEVFERYRTSVDVVTTSEVSVSVTIDDDRRIDEIAAALREFAEVTVEPNMSLLCAVGENLRADPAFAIRMLAGLDGIPLRMVSQAASRRNVTVVLRDGDVGAAMSRLHDAWFTDTAAATPVEATR
jgi:aspartate kinase